MFPSFVLSCVRSTLKWLRSPFRSWFIEAPITFPTSGFEIIPDHHVVEEEMFEEFFFGDYYPIKIGDVLLGQYQIIGKLGFGSTSTNWLARDLKRRQYVALKNYIRTENGRQEYERVRYIQDAYKHRHDGGTFIRDVLDLITLPRPGGNHDCLVQTPLGQSLYDLQLRLPTRLISESMVKSMLKQLFWALEYLHKYCGIVHTDIKLDNILQVVEDEPLLDIFVQDELKNPCPRKITGERTVYASRALGELVQTSGIKLCDLGSAVRGDKRRNHGAQPNFFRSPEVIVKAEWSYPIDIWSVGMITWQLLEGELLFTGDDHLEGDYSVHAHLAEMIGVLGLPPRDLLERGIRTDRFFDRNGKWLAREIPIHDTSLEECVTFCQGEDKKLFLSFLRGMLQWRPEDRKSARELLRHPWLHTQTKNLHEERAGDAT